MEQKNTLTYSIRSSLCTLAEVYVLFLLLDSLNFGTDRWLFRAISTAVIFIAVGYPWSFNQKTLIIDAKGVLVKSGASDWNFSDKYMEFGNISRVVASNTLYGRRIKFYSDKGAASAYPKDVDAVVDCLMRNNIHVEGWHDVKPNIGKQNEK